jgi:hypothetical protein
MAMAAAAATNNIPPGPKIGGAQIGGARGGKMNIINPVLDEIQEMAGHFLLIALVLISVYVSRIPPTLLEKFKGTGVQIIGLLVVIFITGRYGWIHGILAALCFALIVSRALKAPSLTGMKEGMTDFVPMQVVVDASNPDFVPQKHRWFVERVLGENPLVINEKEVATAAIQDMSEKSFGGNKSSV